MTGKDKNAWVETLLASTPLEVADDGFSNKILAEIHARQKRRLTVLAPFFALGIASLLAFFPYRIFEALSGSLALDYGAMQPALVPVLVVLGMILFFSFSEEAA
ncbi:MAG: hypothetical protein IH901_08065 [Proteobacteria bacterium]|nr:hypothetical protein [Pseudomonadota bacterium]